MKKAKIVIETAKMVVETANNLVFPKQMGDALVSDAGRIAIRKKGFLFNRLNYTDNCDCVKIFSLRFAPFAERNGHKNESNVDKRRRKARMVGRCNPRN